MPIPLEVTFRNFPRSPALESRARLLARRLERFSPNIVRCHVTLEAPHRHHRHGKLFEAHVHVTVPGQEIVIRHARSGNPTHQDAYVALQDAFTAARRQLQAYKQRRAA